MNRIVVSQSTVQVLRRHRPVHSTVVKVHKRRRAARGPPALLAGGLYILGSTKARASFVRPARGASGAAPKRAHTLPSSWL